MSEAERELKRTRERREKLERGLELERVKEQEWGLDREGMGEIEMVRKRVMEEGEKLGKKSRRFLYTGIAIFLFSRLVVASVLLETSRYTFTWRSLWSVFFFLPLIN